MNNRRGRDRKKTYYKIETPYDQEANNKKHENIKANNNQIVINMLKAQGIDEIIPRHEFDKLLRIMKEDNMLREKHNKLMLQFSEIVAPYKATLL